MPAIREGLALEAWPAGDQAAWSRARLQGDVLDPGGSAAHWRPKTVRPMLGSYGLWLLSLQRAGALDPMNSPIQRIDRDTLRLFIDFLRQRHVASATLAMHVRNLYLMLRAFEPTSELGELRRLANQLDAQIEPTRNKAGRLVPPNELIAVGIALMKNADRAGARRCGWAATGYRDGLIIALLATRPLRLANLAQIDVNRHLLRRGDSWWLRFIRAEMKAGQPLEFPLPTMLVPWLERYLEVWRPLFQPEAAEQGLWLSIRGRRMSEEALHSQIKSTTARTLGRPINPHLFRDCVATFIAETAPDEVRIVARILGHHSLATSNRHYNHARMAAAHARYLDTIDTLRQGSEGQLEV